MLTDDVAEMLKSARAALGISQKELARRAGVSQRLWSEAVSYTHLTLPTICSV